MQRTIILDADIHDADPEKLVCCFEPWVKKLANRYKALLAQTGAVGFDDLVQVGEIALLQAQKKYDPAAGISFLKHSRYYIMNAMRKELGITSDGKLPVSLKYLDEPLTEDAEESMLDMLADESIEPDDERIQRLERYEELHRAIGRLKNKKHREIIQRVYFDEEERQHAAAAMGMKVGAFYSADREALSKLRRDHKLKQLCAPVFSTSYSRFRITFTSAVEAEVLWKERETDRLLGNGAYMRMNMG